VINHAGRSIQEVYEGGAVHRIPYEGLPDNVIAWNGALVTTSHSAGTLVIARFDPGTRRFTMLHRHAYPYGDTRFDSGNVSFYLRGQFGDAIFSLTDGKIDADGRLWITDLLGGKLFILAPGDGRGPGR
jgi:hypothetical protein